MTTKLKGTVTNAYYSHLSPTPFTSGFTTANGFHVQGMAEREFNVVVCAEIGNPVPGEHALGTDNQIILIIGYQFD